MGRMMPRASAGLVGLNSLSGKLVLTPQMLRAPWQARRKPSLSFSRTMSAEQAKPLRGGKAEGSAFGPPLTESGVARPSQASAHARKAMASCPNRAML